MTLKYLKIGILAAAATVGLMAGLRKVGEMFSLEFFKKAVAVAAVMAAAGTANASTVYENQLDGSDTGTYRFDLTCSMGCEVAFFDYTGTFDTGTDGAFVDWSVLFGDTVDYLGTAAGATGTGSAWEEDLIFQITGLLFTGDKDEGPGGAGFGEDFTFTTDAAYLIFRGYISKSAEAPLAFGASVERCAARCRSRGLDTNKIVVCGQYGIMGCREHSELTGLCTI